MQGAIDVIGKQAVNGLKKFMLLVQKRLNHAISKSEWCEKQEMGISC